MSTPYLGIWTGAQVDEGITRAYAAKERLDSIYDGTLDLADAVEGGAVVGLDLPFIPVRVLLTVEVPANGMILFAVPIRGTLTANGFEFYLSGLTDSINYRLHYVLFGDITMSSSTI